jgi:hypothetical protein
MEPESSGATGVRAFLIDYAQRHAHPVNAILHVPGVPLAFYGLYSMLTGGFPLGLSLFVGGYFLQWVGHRVQGNEVGEVILIRSLWQRLQARRSRA